LQRRRLLTLWEEEKKWSLVWASGYNRQENSPFQDPSMFFSGKKLDCGQKKGSTILLSITGGNGLRKLGERAALCRAPANGKCEVNPDFCIMFGCEL
jgi:hypothetical protein